MALYLLSLMFFCTDIIARLALRARSWRAVELTLVAGLSLAWLLYPQLSDWVVPYMPVEQGMLVYALLVGLQLGLMDAALRTGFARLCIAWKQAHPAPARRH